MGNQKGERQDKSPEEDTSPREKAPRKPEKMPPAGPHASEELTDREKTPGTGSMPDATNREADVGPD